MKEYGIVAEPSSLELDHIWAIEDSGDPRDPSNLWPEYWHLDVNGYDAGAKTKDILENRVKKNLCAGKMTLKDVQVCFSDWITCYRKVIGELPEFQAVN